MYNPKWQLLFFSILTTYCLPSWADSAEAWQSYQEGRDPGMELGLLILGVIVGFSLLVAVNKYSEKRKKLKKRK